MKMMVVVRDVETVGLEFGGPGIEVEVTDEELSEFEQVQYIYWELQEKFFSRALKARDGEG